MNCRSFSQKRKSKEEYEERIRSFQKFLKENQIDSCVIEDPIDLFYLTGTPLSAGQLWIHQKAALLLVDGRYQESAKAAPLPSDVFSKDRLKKFCEKNPIVRVAFDATKLSFQRVQEIKELIRNVMGSKACQWIPFKSPTSALRAVKSTCEITALKKSAQLLWKGYQFLKKQLKEGMTEQELAKKFEIYCLENGARGLAFEPIIAFGPNSALPHHRPGKQKLKKGDLVLIDIGVDLNYYHSDMTRVVFFACKDPLLQSWYKIIQRAHAEALRYCRPGMRFGQLDEAARSILKKEEVEPYFVHSLGHGIGLETHEMPRIRFDSPHKDMLLEPGMVFTIEPGLYLPGRGGVRYENMILITEKGHENFFPREKA